MSEDRYPFKDVETKWRDWWRENKIHQVKLDVPNGHNKYILVMFSYPSSSKLHIGHWWNYGPTDTYARFLRMQGYNVFEPMGFDSFGLPAENYAIKMNSHPRTITEESIDFIEKQLEEIGAMYDWRYKVVTSRPEYYKWTQWLFVQLYKKNLAYQKEGLVNWCPSCQTVLANEQVSDGECERCSSVVNQRKMTQWYFKITDYAEKLLEGLDREDIDWPESTVKRQKNWIGKSQGANIRFKLESDENKCIEAFTTRPDTIFGVTYVVLAPENSLVEELATDEQREFVEGYVKLSMQQTDVERTSTTREKSGVFTGSYCIHPFTGEKIQIWVADYVLGSYGTGAVMAVPAHDQRDFEFAGKYKLPIKVVIRPKTNHLEVEEMREAYEGPGIMSDSGAFSGVGSEDGKRAVAEKLEKMDMGGTSITYRLRDWSISRQRYWGAPIPIIHCEKCGTVPVPEKDLPVELPVDISEFRPKGSSPLGGVEEWMNTTCPECGGPARRDPDTMDTFVCSSFYHMRYLAADNNDEPFNKERLKKWMPIDLYVGGPEHATGHLIYFRFITKFLHDLGWIEENEPAKKLIHQGIITHEGHRMSKSRGNVVNPDEFVKNYGSDVFRMYLMFMGDYTSGGDWSDKGINGIDRFINRIWRLVNMVENPETLGKLRRDDFASNKKLYRLMQATTKAVTTDLKNLSYNTCISRMMELVNGIYSEIDLDKPLELVVARIVKTLIRILAPFAPHFAEEAWSLMGGESSVFNQRWPNYDEAALKEDTITLVVQVNGKLRDRIDVAAKADKETLENTALESDKVKEFIEGKTVRKVIVIPGKLVNIVVS